MTTPSSSSACHLALGEAEYYEHSKTESWNTTIINSILRALISESSSTHGGTPPFKFTVNSTIIQHLVPTSVIQRTKAAQEITTSKSKDSDASPTLTNPTKDSATGADGRPHVGRRGMHSATGAYWNEKTDGMWSFKYDGGDRRGLDVVISIVWIAL
ncbi:putative dynein light chain [Golovinomyces cichoracearum]|uniref:Putative dynein light chain n=1 Tax=Golovinomyces cichoracearum TaxID=62708 RepID=A0A420HRL5_9PEZI|nr:putative dynein light chain [Golovinomyces cichoracearum]